MREIGWLDTALLSDIRSLIKGGLRFKNANSLLLGGVCGAGNVSIPVLICTGLELAAALYTGKTEYNMGNRKYKASDNVQEFIVQYFPLHTKQIPRILWDAIRNGTHHLFLPKDIKRSRKRVRFMFYVDDVRIPSHVTKNRNIIEININSIEFYRILKKALTDYKAELITKPKLQKNFVKAWKSIKPRLVKTSSLLSSEIDYLSNQLKNSGKFTLFQ